MEVSAEEIMARVKDRMESAVSGLCSCEGNELYRCQGDFRTLNWILGLPDQIEAERELDRQRHDAADDV